MKPYTISDIISLVISHCSRYHNDYASSFPDDEPIPNLFCMSMIPITQCHTCHISLPQNFLFELLQEQTSVNKSQGSLSIALLFITNFLFFFFLGT